MAANIKDYVCGSCAGGEIISLSTHSNATDAMIHFCKTVLGLPGGVRTGFYKSKTSPSYNCTSAHYVFIAGPEEGTGRGWPKYGTEFAQFITDHKFGLVATLPPIKNRKYHPDTSCQIWIWQPDQAALEAWWEVEGKAAIEAAAKEAAEKARIAAEAKAKAAQAAAELVERQRVEAEKIIAKYGHVGGATIVNHHSAAYVHTGDASCMGKITIKRLAEDYYTKGTNYIHATSASGGENYTVHSAGPKLDAGKTYKILNITSTQWVLVDDSIALKEPEAPPKVPEGPQPDGARSGSAPALPAALPVGRYLLKKRWKLVQSPYGGTRRRVYYDKVPIAS